MSKQTINDGEGGLPVRDALNSNFTELYDNLPIPVKIAGMNVNYTQAIDANVMITMISISPASGGTVTLRIGTSPNGQQILDDTEIAAFQPVQAAYYFASAGSLYFTFSAGSGTLNVRIDVIRNFN